jgi:uncharacterized membrane protein YdbT with pleckstrin-like domain
MPMPFRHTLLSIYIYKYFIMNRIKISRSRPIVKYLAFVVTLFCLYIMAMYIGKDTGTTLTGAIAVIFFIAGYRQYYSLEVTFDDENMYVTNRKFNNTVPLKQITAIKLTSSRIVNSHYWDIYYNDTPDNNETTTSILPNYKQFALFKNKVAEKNPDVKITDSIFF